MTKKLPLNSLSESVMEIVIYNYIITLCYNYNLSIFATRLTYTQFITTCKIIIKTNKYIFFQSVIFYLHYFFVIFLKKVENTE